MIVFFLTRFPVFLCPLVTIYGVPVRILRNYYYNELTMAYNYRTITLAKTI